MEGGRISRECGAAHWTGLLEAERFAKEEGLAPRDFHLFAALQGTMLNMTSGVFMALNGGSIEVGLLKEANAGDAGGAGLHASGGVFPSDAAERVDGFSGAAGFGEQGQAGRLALAR